VSGPAAVDTASTRAAGIPWTDVGADIGAQSVGNQIPNAVS
jgi:hypothetical protein